MILPQLIVSMTAISASRSRRSVATRCMMRDRSSGVIRGHGPSSNALRGGDRAIDVLHAGLGHAADRLVRRRADRLERLAAAAGTLSPPMIRS